MKFVEFPVRQLDHGAAMNGALQVDEIQRAPIRFRGASSEIVALQGTGAASRDRMGRAGAVFGFLAVIHWHLALPNKPYG
jgi:hypothetical protein